MNMAVGRGASSGLLSYFDQFDVRLVFVGWRWAPNERRAFLQFPDSTSAMHHYACRVPRNLCYVASDVKVLYSMYSAGEYEEKKWNNHHQLNKSYHYIIDGTLKVEEMHAQAAQPVSIVTDLTDSRYLLGSNEYVA